jgi:hypothetical protein
MTRQVASKRTPSLLLLTALAVGCGAEYEAQTADELADLDAVSDTAVVDDVSEVGADGLEASSELDSEEEIAPEIGAPEPGRDVSGLTLASTRTEMTLPARGGTGGSYVGHAGQGVIYGLGTHTTQFVNGLGIYYYMPSKPDNRYRDGDAHGSLTYGDTATSYYMGSASFPYNNEKMLECPGNQVVIGIRGSRGSFLDSIGIVCSDSDHPDPFSPDNYLSPIHGGGGGSFFDDRCPAGYLVTGFNLRHGGYIDRLQPICIAAHGVDAATIVGSLSGSLGQLSGR